jgi:hypothetical protein
VPWNRLKRIFSSTDVRPAAKLVAKRERRGAVRKRQRMMEGFIWTEHMAFSKACTIRNLSATGARADLLSGTVKTHALTGTVTLYLGPDKREIDCQMVWRIGRSIGLRFIGPFRPPTRQYGKQGTAS